MVLKMVMSGGQTGADLGGLAAAKACGIFTGGWCPKGYRNEMGQDLRLKDFGLREHPSDRYPPRTDANVRDSDGTIRFASNFSSPGEKCTLKAIVRHGKPYQDVIVNLEVSPVVYETAHEQIKDWIRYNNIQILNVAGNKESSCLGIEEFVKDFLTKVFQMLKEKP